jgi:hypothetical protein
MQQLITGLFLLTIGPTTTTTLLLLRSYGKPEAATAIVELLMMGVRTPETC